MYRRSCMEAPHAQIQAPAAAPGPGSLVRGAAGPDSLRRSRVLVRDPLLGQRLPALLSGRVLPSLLLRQKRSHLLGSLLVIIEKGEIQMRTRWMLAAAILVLTSIPGASCAAAEAGCNPAPAVAVTNAVASQPAPAAPVLPVQVNLPNPTPA